MEEQYGPDRTILTLSLIKSDDKKLAIKNGDKKSAIKNGDKDDRKVYSKKTEEQLRRIIEYMEIGKEYKTVEIAEGIGLKPSRTRDLLKCLVERNKVVAIGTNRSRVYRKRD